MKSDKVDIFILNKSSLFPSALVPYIRERLLVIDDESWQRLSTMQFRNPMIALLLSIGCGTYGADRFYTGQYLLGIFKLITTVTFLAIVIIHTVWSIENWVYIILMMSIMSIVIFWYFIDIFLITKTTKELNYNKLLTILN